MSVAVLQVWVCANRCGQTYRSDRILPNRFHTCPRLHGMTAPMVLEGTSAKVELVERQDYVGRDIVARDDRGRAIMSVVTTRDDGQDVAVFVPTVTARVG